MLTKADIAKEFGVHPQTVRRWCKRGLKAIRISSKCVRFQRSDVDKFVSKQGIKFKGVDL